MNDPAPARWKIPLFNLQFDKAEMEAVRRVFDRAWLTMGPENQEFEEKFGEFHQSRFCLSVNSCTAALHMAVEATGAGEGDEIIVPSLTFVATVNAVRYVRAVPVFGDVIGASRPVLDPLSVESRITAKTKAIIVVHYAGYPCDMDAFVALSKKHGLALIEDCAHSPGAKWNGRFLGTWGDAGCFSFFSNKNMSMGEGGAILTQSESLAQRCRLLRSHGMTTLTLDRHKGHSFTYDVVATGYNYRLDEMRAAIGLVQLEKLPQMNARRKVLVERYRELLGSCPVEVPYLGYEKADGVDHIMPVFLPRGTDRNKIMTAMREHGVQTSIHYPAVHRFSSFKGNSHEDLGVTEDLCERELTLPLYPSLTDEEVGYVVTSLKTALNV